MKLGLAINAFEGTEHLYNIISEIRDLVNIVIVGLQHKSYTGIPIDPYDERECQRLQEEGLVDDILYIETDPSQFSRVQETFKRNLMIVELEKHKCDYVLVIDSDEFYTHNSFKRAKEYIEEHNIEVSYCRYMNYWRSPVDQPETYQYYLVYPFHKGNYVPFISKAKYKFKWQCKDFTKPSDPTRRYELPKEFKKDITGNIIYKESKKSDGTIVKIATIDHYLVENYEFEWKDLKMHHFSWIRNNIRKKMMNWSSKSYFSKPWEIIDRAAYQYDNFKDGDKDAILLFKTPDNKVEIAKMDKQYIFPKVDIKKRDFPCKKDVKIKVIYTLDVDEDYSMILSKLLNDKDSDYFILYKGTIEEKLYDKIKDIVSKASDDSLIYTDILKYYISDSKSIALPSGNFVVFSKSTRDKLCDPIIHLKELNHIMDPLSIIGLTIERYFSNLGIDYKSKLVKI